MAARPLIAPQSRRPSLRHYLTTHLASHGYLVAALDHSEVVAPEFAGNVQGFVANRVPDARFLLD